MEGERVSEFAGLASLLRTDVIPIVRSGDTDNYSMPINLLGDGPTFMIAANDATARIKAKADYICDGTGDNVQIQAAIDALPPNGGRIVLSEGVFNISDTITVSQGTTIEGMGEQSTSIELPDDPDFDAINLTGGVMWTVIRGLELLGNAPLTPTYSTDGIVISGSMIHLENLYIRAFPRNGIYATNFVHLRLINVYSSFHKIGAGAYLRRAAIGADAANQIYIEGGNYLANKTFGIYLYHVSNALIQVCNLGDNETAGIGIVGGTNITMQNSWFESNENGLHIRTGNISIGRSNDANEIAVKNSVFYSNTTWDIDAFDTVGIRIEDCRGDAIRLGNSVEEAIYDHSFFTAETLLDVKKIKNGGTSAAIATGGTIAHGLATTPTIVQVNAAEAGPTDITISVDATNITVNFGGGGNKTFFWYARVSP